MGITGNISNSTREVKEKRKQKLLLEGKIQVKQFILASINKCFFMRASDQITVAEYSI